VSQGGCDAEVLSGCRHRHGTDEIVHTREEKKKKKK
jgi:hypothetical protein